MGSRRPDPPLIKSHTRTDVLPMGSHVKPHAVAQIPPRKESYRTDVPREDERESVAAPRALHPRLRVEPARRVAAAQQIVAGKGHLLAEEVEVVREAEVPT